ncbi:tetratricopeptide repeat protein [Calditrichota bacterium GD2]
MNIYKIINFYILMIFIFIYILSCKKSNKYDNKEPSLKYSNVQLDSSITMLNKRAMKLYTKYLVKEKNKSLLEKALRLLNKAIKIDSTSVTSYVNKSIILCTLKKYNKAINNMETILKINKNSAEGFSFLGFLYEKTGNLEKANKMYLKALKIYENRIKKNPSSISDQINKAFILLFIKNKNYSLKEINKIIIKHPNNIDLKKMKEMIIEFDRKKFIDNLCSQEFK